MTCNGNCNQGRQCDCVPDVDVPMEPATPGETATLIVVCLLGVRVMVVGICAIAGYLWQRFAS